MTKEHKTGGSAFPFQGAEWQQIENNKPGIKALVEVTYPGMTLLDYFAGKAMESIIGRNELNPQHVAHCAYKYASAMIDEHNRIMNTTG